MDSERLREQPAPDEQLFERMEARFRRTESRLTRAMIEIAIGWTAIVGSAFLLAWAVLR